MNATNTIAMILVWQTRTSLSNAVRKCVGCAYVCGSATYAKVCYYYSGTSSRVTIGIVPTAASQPIAVMDI
jgi:hypothetical protein